MTLLAGDAACTTGLSKAIYDARAAAAATIGLATDRGPAKADCYAIATAIVDYLKANAAVMPTMLVAPPGGGPVTGTGTIT